MNSLRYVDIDYEFIVWKYVDVILSTFDTNGDRNV